MARPFPTVPEQQAIVSDVLASSQATRSELPALGPPQIVHKWERFIAEWKESIEDWLHAFLERQGAINPEYLSVLFTTLGYCLVVVVLALFLFFLFKHLRSRISTDDTFKDGERDESRDEGLSLQESLSDSLARGAFAAALRIRWKIFLARTGQAPSITPRESRQRFITAESHALVCTLEEPMFSGRRVTIEEYDTRDNVLLAAEGDSHGD